MNDVDTYILKRSLQVIANELHEAGCDHEWYKHGYGYKCKNCDYYTGMNEDLNKLIAAEKKG